MLFKQLTDGLDNSEGTDCGKSGFFRIFAGYYVRARGGNQKTEIKITIYDIKRDQKSLP